MKLKALLLLLRKVIVEEVIALERLCATFVASCVLSFNSRVQRCALLPRTWARAPKRRGQSKNITTESVVSATALWLSVEILILFLHKSEMTSTLVFKSSSGYSNSNKMK